MAMEILVATSAVRNLIREGKTHQINNVLVSGVQTGMQTLNQALRNLYMKGLVTYEEATSKTSDLDDFHRLIGKYK